MKLLYVGLEEIPQKVRCFICLHGLIFGLPEGQAQGPPMPETTKGEEREREKSEGERGHHFKSALNPINFIYVFIMMPQ